MKKLIFFVVLVVSISCSKPEKNDLKTFIENKIWIEFDKKGDARFSHFLIGKEKKIYEWIDFDVYGNASYTTIPKNDPIKDPSLKRYLSKEDGWYYPDDYLIKSDSLITQDEDDITGKDILVRQIEIQNDTTIGIHKYNRLKVIVHGKDAETGMPKKHELYWLSKVE